MLRYRPAHTIVIEFEETQPSESTPLNVTNPRDLWQRIHSISSNAVSYQQRDKNGSPSRALSERGPLALRGSMAKGGPLLETQWPVPSFTGRQELRLWLVCVCSGPTEAACKHSHCSPLGSPALGIKCDSLMLGATRIKVFHAAHLQS